MKKIVSIMLLLVLFAFLLACGQVEKNKKIEYRFYSEMSTTEDSVSVAVDGFQSASELNFSSAKKISINDADKIDSEKTISISGTKLKMTYQGSKQMEYDSHVKEELRTNNIVDRYECTEGEIRCSVKIFRNTGKLDSIIYYSRTSDKDLPFVKLEDKDLISKAEQVLSEQYGKDVLDEYILDRVEYVEDKAMYHVFYQRFMHGYAMDTFFSVYFNHNFELRALLSYRHSEYESVENDVTKEMIQQAEKALRERVPSTMTVQEDTMKVLIDYNTGKLYLQLYARRNNPVIHPETGEESYSGELFYVNIN